MGSARFLVILFFWPVLPKALGIPSRVASKVSSILIGSDGRVRPNLLNHDATSLLRRAELDGVGGRQGPKKVKEEGPGEEKHKHQGEEEVRDAQLTGSLSHPNEPPGSSQGQKLGPADEGFPVPPFSESTDAAVHQSKKIEEQNETLKVRNEELREYEEDDTEDIDPMQTEAIDNIFHFTNQRQCSGNWLHYLLRRTPLHQRQCAEACLAKQQCLGFDWRRSQCRLFTIMPVGISSWGPVSFNTEKGGAFGSGTFATSTADLGNPVPLTVVQTLAKPRGCYIRRAFRAADSYFHEVGSGMCAATNQSLQYYKVMDIDSAKCINACSAEDLCIAYSWHEPEEAKNSSDGTCNLYTQKKIFSWIGVTPKLHSQGAQAVFADSPFKLVGTGDVTSSSATRCMAKSSYTAFEDLFARVGRGLCQTWMHTASKTDTKKECMKACDELQSCVGFDYDRGNCRVFPSVGSNATVAGAGIYDRLAPDSSVLASVQTVSTFDAHVDLMGCYRKTHFRTWDMYQLVGNGRCNGGGHWNYYEFESTSSFPLKSCSSKCLEKPECLGFDFGSSLCTFYTSRAVPMGSWPGVRFDDGLPFIGSIVRSGRAIASSYLPEGYVPNVHALKADSHQADGEAEEHSHHCYAKLVPDAPNSYYDVGEGTCSKGGMPSAYSLVHSDRANLTGLKLSQVCALCEDSCNARDECLGYDCGMWLDSKVKQQVSGAMFHTLKLSSAACHMYPSKPVWDWPRVDAEKSGFPRKLLQGKFASNPADLGGESSVLVKSQKQNPTRCKRKAVWINLDQYYTKSAQQPCATYQYYQYRFNGTSDSQGSNGEDGDNKDEVEAEALAQCQEACDMWQACIGLDGGSMGCRLFTSHAISQAWAGVTKNRGKPFPGVPSETGKNEDEFAPHPLALITYQTKPNGTGSCYLKTHAETLHQRLDTVEG